MTTTVTIRVGERGALLLTVSVVVSTPLTMGVAVTRTDCALSGGTMKVVGETVTVGSAALTALTRRSAVPLLLTSSGSPVGYPT